LTGKLTGDPISPAGGGLRGWKKHEKVGMVFVGLSALNLKFLNSKSI